MISTFLLHLYMSLTQNRENVKSKFLAERELIHSGLVPRPHPAHVYITSRSFPAQDTERDPRWGWIWVWDRSRLGGTCPQNHLVICGFKGHCFYLFIYFFCFVLFFVFILKEHFKRLLSTVKLEGFQVLPQCSPTGLPQRLFVLKNEKNWGIQIPI